MWLIPLWTLGLIPFLDRFSEKRWLHVVAGTFLAIGCFSTYWPIENPWTAPWMFSLLDRYELLDQYEDPVPDLDRTHYVWFSRLPVSQDPANPESITLSGWDHLGHHRFIRLVDKGRADGLQTLVVEESLFSNVPQQREIVVDVEKFEAGKKISEWLIFPDDDAPAQRAELIRLFRGVPGGRAYNRGRIRYVRTRLRTDAFTVHHAAVSGDESRGEPPAKLAVRCDTWYSNDLPFGVAQVKFSVTRDSDGVEITELLLRVEQASSFPDSATTSE
jgi:hypothetical protein